MTWELKLETQDSAYEPYVWYIAPRFIRPKKYNNNHNPVDTSTSTYY